MRDIVFFFDQPPKVGKGCFNQVTKIINNDVVYAYLNDFGKVRKDVNWEDGDYGNAKLLYLGHDSKTVEKVDNLFNSYPNAIFVICGLKSNVVKYLKPYIFSEKYKFICFAERPGSYGTIWKRVIKKLYVPLSEMWLARKYVKYIDGFLPLGIIGVKTYKKYGWPEEKLYPFMYDPVDFHNECSFHEVNKPIKFLYVGRFSKFTKGTDILQKAFDLLKNDASSYSLSMVGGYGDMRDEILAWIKTKANIEFLGKWDSNDVSKKMNSFDICIVPSKFDGWNLLVNEAIRAHIGIIVTDEAVSDEVVKQSRAGLVVKANDPVELAKAIEFAISNPKEIEQWKRNAINFEEKISNDTVANYFINVLKYIYGEEKEYPICPWLKER